MTISPPPVADRLNSRLAWLLGAGTWASCGLITVGMILSALGAGSRLEGEHFVSAGIVLLIALPALRVAMMGVWFLLSRDLDFAVVAAFILAIIVLSALCAGRAVAQEADKDPAAVVEIGAAGAQSLKGEGSSFGPTIAVEVTPVENWLELEGGVTPLFSHGGTEWSMDLLFKKPWTLSDKVEFMAGVGPEWVHTTSHGQTTDSVAGEAALDFMFWPSAKHRVGWYLEPSYDYGFGRGHEQSLGVNVGLIVAIR
jgi:hypothetical protein